MAVKKKRKKVSSKKRTSVDWPSYGLRFDPAEFRNKLRIDKHALDDEVERQAELYGEVAEAAVIAKSEMDSLEEQLKELESEIDSRARSDANANEERITENEIKALVAGDKSRKVMVVKLLNARHVHRQLEALSISFRQRSYALRDMVDLCLSSYYSSRSAGGAREDQRDAEVDRLTGKMKERRKGRVKRHRKRSPVD